MTDNVLPFRPADGTNAQDFVSIHPALIAGWRASTMHGDVPWIALDGPGGAEWNIGRQAGKFHVWSTTRDGAEVELEGFASAREAAEAAIREWASIA